MKKILVLKGESEYNVLRCAVDEICMGFEKSGYVVELIDSRERCAMEQFAQALCNVGEYAAYFSMQALLWDEEQNAFPQLQGVKRIGWIVDDPVYHTLRLHESVGANARVLLVRDSHALRLRKEYPKFERVDTLYHGGFYSGERIPFSRKDIDVFFSGTYLSINEAEDGIKKMTGGFGRIAWMAKSQMEICGMTEGWQEQLRMCLKNLAFEISEEEFQVLCTEMYPLEYYQRAYLRQRMIEALLENGIQVAVAGRGWSRYEGAGRENLCVLSGDGVDITEAIRLMQRSRIVLNLTNFFDGMHERIFTAMLAGAVCVTNEYKLLEDFFSGGKELVTFPLDHLEKLPEQVKKLLANPTKAEQIAKAGYQTAKEHHTWERRGEQIAQWLEKGSDFTY